MTAAPRPVVAAFDFDGTLTHGGSVVPYLVAVRGLAPVARAVAAGLPALVRGAVLSGAAADDAKESLFERVLAGVPAEEAARLGAAFARRHLDARLRRDTSARLEWHKAQGHAVVLVSASPECYVRPAAELLGADGAVATRLAVEGGVLTGRYAGRNCRGGEKLAGVAEWLRDRGFPADAVEWAYGNSRGDRRLLEGARHGVNAGRLGRLGRLRRFPRLADVLREAPTD